MPGKIFVNYRRDDARDTAARIRDRLASTFGDANVFMDVDNLLAGQRFDKELEKALAQTDVFLAVIGPRWLELLAERLARGERDYVREEIAGALQRGVVVIPVLIERTPLPRRDALPENITDLALHQTHEVVHARFGRDVADLIEAIGLARKAARAEGRSAVRWVGAVTLAALVLGGGVLAYQLVPIPWASRDDEARRQPEPKPEPSPVTKVMDDALRKSERLLLAKAEEARKQAEEAARQRLATLKAEEEEKKGEPDLLRPGRVFRDCPDVCPEMVVLPAGSFTMGSPESEAGRDKNEGPQRRVTIASPFAVGKFEVTFAEWDACVSAGGCKHTPGDAGWGRGRRPVINVSLHDAKEYAAWLSRKTGKAYRLLSEAEWEYAARAGTAARYAFGDTITKTQAQYEAGKSAEVGSFPANKFGLHDMHGNVWEWVEDGHYPNYQGAPIDGSVWSGGDASYRVLRGGSWNVSDPNILRSAVRIGNNPGVRNVGIGFRLARTL